MLKPVSLALAAAGALLVSACGDNTEAPEPAGETTAAQMPDTSAPTAGPAETAPDAGATGVAPAPDQPTPETQPPGDTGTTSPTP